MPTDALDVLAVLLPSAAVVALSVWLAAVRGANQWRAREIERKDERIAQLTQQLAEADAACRIEAQRANQWHTAWQVERATALNLHAQSEARSN